MREGALRVAVVGAGPSGVYATQALSSREDHVFDVDLFDALPVPFGLVRYGVAPDHLSIRGVRDTLDKTLDNPGVQFVGNVVVGTDITLDQLRADYDAVILTYGASSDQRLGIEGEDLPGSIAATDLVAWYCGHPDGERIRMEGVISGATSAVVVGVGNVAVDVARILAKEPGALDSTDMPQHVLEALSDTSITDIHVLGRRGPVQASFTTKELKELGELTDVDVIVRPEDLNLDPVSATSVADNKVAGRNLEVLREWSMRTPTGARRRLHMNFFSRPVEVVGEDRVTGVLVERTSLGIDGSLSGTGEKELLPAQLVVRSVGYRGVGIAGVDVDPSTGTIANVDGRVTDAQGPTPGLYVAGWIKRGPSGIIGTNKKCATATVESVVADVEAGVLLTPDAPGSVLLHLSQRESPVITSQGWRSINTAEQDLGATRARERTTIHQRADLIRAAQSE